MTTTTPSARAADVAGRSLAVTVTGAFLTGTPLRIPVARYRRAQDDLACRLPPGWSRTAEPEGTYRSGGGFADALPLVLVTQRGTLPTAAVAEQLVRAAPLAGGDPVGPPVVEDVRIDLYDQGVGILSVDLSFPVAPGTGFARAADLIKQAVWLRPAGGGRLPPLAHALQTIARSATAAIRVAVAGTDPDLPQVPWGAPAVDDPEAGSADWGRLLWLHPVHVVPTAAGDGSADALVVAPPFHGACEVPGGTLLPGIGWSALVADDVASAKDVALRLIELHWAYIALQMEIDRGLLAAMERALAAPARQSLRATEAAADAAFGAHMRVEEARARMATRLAGLGGDEQGVWEELARVTRYDALVAGVDAKITSLSRMSERRAQQAAAARARRTTAILSVLTAMTTLTVAAALVGSFVGTLSDEEGSTAIRVAAVALAVVVSLVVLTLAHLDRPARARRRGSADPFLTSSQ